MHSKTIARLVVATLMGSTSLTVMAASANYIGCYGVSTQGANVPVIMTADNCQKLAGGMVKPLPAKLQATAAQMKPVSSSDYVQCYGVAAAGKNDCATNSAACGGNVKTARDPHSWVSLPKGLCEQIKGGKLSA